MFKPAVYENVWIRRVPPGWDGRSDIRPTVVKDGKVTVAIFAFPDSEFLFMEMVAIREVVAGLTPGKNGSLIFSIDAKSKTLTSKLRSIHARMEMNRPKESKARASVLDGWED